MPFAKKTTKSPAVMVETKKLSAKDTCGMECCGKIKHLWMAVLVILNTIMIICILRNQSRFEYEKVGGRANYNMVRQIYRSDAFKAQQKQQIEQALQMYQGGATTQQSATATAPTADTTKPEAQQNAAQ